MGMPEQVPDERPHRRREYSGPASTLGLAALVLLAVAGGLWWFQMRKVGEPSSGSASGGEFGIVALADSDNPTGRPAAASPGRAAPNWLLLSDTGGRVALTGLRGNWVVLQFWASWCEMCRTTAPDLQALQDGATVAGRKLVVVGINQQESEAKLVEFRRDFALTFPLVLDLTGEVSQTYRVSRNLPVTFVIDPAGVVQKVYLGSLAAGDLAQIAGMTG